MHYFTGIDRKQIHVHRFLYPEFPSDEFTLGWHVHCLYDQSKGDIN
ncbi:hypothetical protein [uncultured Desulfosarcina sp.]|nr:hypothetical protein [uncultured Desulfosarcina sp.]